MLTEAQSKSSVAISADHHGVDAIHAVNDDGPRVPHPMHGPSFALRGSAHVPSDISPSFPSTCLRTSEKMVSRRPTVRLDAVPLFSVHASWSGSFFPNQARTSRRPTRYPNELAPAVSETSEDPYSTFVHPNGAKVDDISDRIKLRDSRGMGIDDGPVDEVVGAVVSSDERGQDDVADDPIGRVLSVSNDVGEQLLEGLDRLFPPRPSCAVQRLVPP